MADERDRPDEEYRDPTAPPPPAGTSGDSPPDPFARPTAPPGGAPTPSGTAPASGTPASGGQQPVSYPYGGQQAPTPPGGQPPQPYSGPPSQHPPYPQQAPSYGQTGPAYPYQQPGVPYGSPPAPAYGPPPAYGSAPTNNASAIILTIVSGVSLVFCGGLLVIPALIFGIMALTKQSSDPEGSRRLTRNGWIAYVIGILVTILAIVGIIAFFVSSSSNPGYSPGTY